MLVICPLRPAAASAAPAELDEEPLPEQSSTSTIDAPNTSTESQAAPPKKGKKRRKKPTTKKATTKKAKRTVGPILDATPVTFNLPHRNNDNPPEVEES